MIRRIKLFFSMVKHYYRIECAGEGPNVIVFDHPKRDKFKAWLRQWIVAEYPDETSSVGRGQ
jgi:hypothetical protein